MQSAPTRTFAVQAALRLMGCVLALILATAGAGRAGEAQTSEELTYATHDGVVLKGTFYRPSGAGPAPVIVAVHGGGWRLGDRTVYRYWGPYLAAQGYAVFAIEYRLGPKTYPQAVQDVRAAVQYVRGRARELGVDPARVGLMGDSAGGQLAALVGLAGEEPQFARGYPGDAYAGVSTAVKVVVGVYGVYDMAEQWRHDQIARPLDQISQNFLGAALMENRKLFFEASPLSYATVGQGKPSFFVVYGDQDDIVDHRTQSEAFVTALKQAKIPALPLAVTGAPHFWVWDPIDYPTSFTGFLAPRLLAFLKPRL